MGRLEAVRRNALPVAPPHFSDRAGDELPEHRFVEIGRKYKELRIHGKAPPAS